MTNKIREKKQGYYLYHLMTDIVMSSGDELEYFTFTDGTAVRVPDIGQKVCAVFYKMYDLPMRITVGEHHYIQRKGRQYVKLKSRMEG